MSFTLQDLETAFRRLKRENATAQMRKHGAELFNRLKQMMGAVLSQLFVFSRVSEKQTLLASRRADSHGLDITSFFESVDFNPHTNQPGNGVLSKAKWNGRRDIPPV